jgi:catechol 2,3-dioxygenase-like lactoylglutathione lyase family enzyme
MVRSSDISFAEANMSVRGLNHITLAVVNLERSLAFYQGVLGLSVRAIWPAGAYLEAGSLWLCLSVDPAAAAGPNDDYTHIAFDVDAEQFGEFSKRVAADAPCWRDNRSEGASLYILDPDGHRMELHVGSLESRLAHYRTTKPADMVVFDA